MPTALLDFQHELLPNTGGPGLVFGKVGTPYFTMEHPQITAGDDRFGDVDLEREDGIVFGEDYAGGKTILFELGVQTWNNANPHLAGADALEVLEQTWRSSAYRSSPTKHAVLRSRAVPGRTRIAYGRPRRYSEATSRLSHRGFSTVLCDFQTIDGKWYDEIEQTQTVKLTFKSSGGFKSPIKTPIRTEPPAVAITRDVVVQGTVPAWPVITINGPVTDAVATLGPLSLVFKGQLLAGESMTFDPRPWSRGVLRQDGANLAGQIGFDTQPMRQFQLPPGTHAFGFLGFDSSGTSTATVSWRNAYTRW